MGELHDRIKLARRERQLSQEYVANYLGVNRTAVVEIEAGKRKVSAEELKKFSQLFQMSADELLYGEELPPVPDIVLFRNFSALDKADQKEILGLIEFKRIKKERGKYGYQED